MQEEVPNDIVHVSDTALMVAACRAMETERLDGLVHDPYAARLAGERGMSIARALPMLPMMCFGVGIRSKFMDEFVLHAIEAGQVKTVLSLGAGLDTRAWRLDIPKHVRWMEVDLPPMLQYKTQMMAGVEPRCRVEHISVDLNGAEERQSLFRNVGDGRALMITEGLLMYLPGETVEAIAVESAEYSGIRYWLMDVQTPAFAKMVRMDAFQSVQNVRAVESLDGLEIYDRCLQAGWRPLLQRRYVKDVGAAVPERVQELAAYRDANKAAASNEPPTPPPTPPPPDDITGVHLFTYGPEAE